MMVDTLTSSSPQHTAARASQAASGASAAEAHFWHQCAEKTPALTRQMLESIPDTPPDLPRASVPYRGALVGLGLVLGAASFTRMFPGRWKWLSGGLATASIGTAVVGTVKANEANIAAQLQGVENLLTLKKAFLNYCDALESDQALRAKLAEHYANTVSAQDIQQQSLEGALLEESAQFARNTPHFHMPAASIEMIEKVDKTSGKAAKADCKICAHGR